MPDGDKFESRLRSKKLRNAYRLVIGGADLDLLAKLLRSDLNEAKRTDYQCDVKDEIARAVYDASRCPLLADQATLGLSEQLDHLVGEQDDSMGARLYAAAAKKVCSQMLVDSAPRLWDT